MAHYYSIKAFANRPCGLEVPLILLDKGLNVATVMTDDIDAVVARLKAQDVEVTEVNALDATGSEPHLAPLHLPKSSEIPALPDVESESSE